MEPLRAQRVAYVKAMKDDWKGMVDFYEFDLNVLAPVTIARHSALHVAVESKRAYPLDALFRIIEERFPVDPESEPGIDNPAFVENAYGNTVLHQAASVGNYEAVKLIAEKFPVLAKKTNKIGETPVFRAASFGNTKIVDYLVNNVVDHIDADGQLSSVHRKSFNGTPILHGAVLGEHFETALFLLKKDKSLGKLKDKDGMTALHLLAQMPSAFRSGYQMTVHTKLLYSCLPVEKYIPLSSSEAGRDTWRHEGAKRIHLSICKFLFNGWPIMKKIWDDKKKHMFALKLANKLIEKDFSWETFVEGKYSDSSGFELLSYIEQKNSGNEEKIGRESDDHNDKKKRKQHEETKEDKQTKETKHKKTEEAMEIQEADDEEEKETKEGDDHNMPNQQLPPSQLNVEELGFEPHKKANKYTPIPLLIATENGIIEIVRKTLEDYPQAVEYIDENGGNILHLAISHRRKEIFKYLLKQMRKAIARLKLGIDNYGYTLLHYAADTEHYIGGSKPGPALQLQEELQWFEVVQELVPSHYALHREKGLKRKKKFSKRFTALELFKETHNDQLEKAQQWVKDTSQSCSTVAVLVATVVFAAAYTVPGGNNDAGVPILSNSPYFLFFTIMDVISLACSLTSVVMFLSILTSPFELQEFRHSLPRKLTFGFTLLFFSVVTTMLTFGATILLTIHLEQKMTSLLSAAAFFPVLVFAVMQFRLYVAFMGTIKEFLDDISNTLPSCFLPFKDKFD